jgi:uncharacterized RDD family membrane protein YckC
MLDHRIEISTPERVTVAYELAGVGSRMLAQVIDGLIVSGILFGLLIAAGAAAGAASGPVVLAIAIGAATLTPVCYFLLLEWLRHGSTPGKAALRLRVVRVTGEPVGLGESAVRNVVRIADFLPGAYVLGGICAMASRDGQRLGDMAAGTIVVRLSEGDATARFAGTFAAAVAESERDPIPAELMAVAVAYRRRAAQIDAEPRAALASRICERIEPFWPRPQGMGEEEYVIRAATQTLPGQAKG